MPDLPPLAHLLRAHGLTARKSLGQHFLLDPNLTDKIARLAVPHPVIVEVGPGPGGLTRSLLKASDGKIIAIETDARFLPLLDATGAAYDGRLDLHHADALKCDIASLDPHRPLRICANLPYNVGTKMLTGWLSATPLFWDRLVLMLQKEVAERIVAKPGEKPYGRLAVLSGSVASAHIAFTVPARAFSPPPKVDSAVIVLDVLPEEKRFRDLKTLGQVTAAAFGQRRKMLRASLKTIAKHHSVNLTEWLEAADIDPQVRPETVSIAGFHRLTETFKSRSTNSAG